MHQSTQKSFGDALEMHWKSMEFNMQGHTLTMPITFSTGETHHLELFITKLDENYSLVLGYDWLA